MLFVKQVLCQLLYKQEVTPLHRWRATILKAFAVHSTNLVQNLVNCLLVGHSSGAVKLVFEGEGPSISYKFFILKVGTQLA